MMIKQPRPEILRLKTGDGKIKSALGFTAEIEDSQNLK